MRPYESGTEAGYSTQGVERGESRTDHNGKGNFLEKTRSGDDAHRLLNMGGLICSSQNVLAKIRRRQIIGSLMLGSGSGLLEGASELQT